MVSEIIEKAEHLNGVIRDEAPTDEDNGVVDDDFSDLTEAELMGQQTLNVTLASVAALSQTHDNFCLRRPRSSNYKLHASKLGA
ncbi:hypothetical protein GN244_ATG07774 [Phytophthora infestans]|uniref:Uncharacterized protein n=1 Tax=Phytophthora infestans TaxID=4787 RepID=A0A833W2P4_PHYIN|nr:hypothetical protein GN244_ATG07774 [Phytophthora infestans]